MIHRLRDVVSRWLLLTVIVFALVGCSSTGQSGTEGSMDVCLLPISQLPVGANEVVAGRSASQLAEGARGPSELPAMWQGQPGGFRSGPDLHQTVAEIELRLDLNSARRVDYGSGCSVELQAEATLGFRTPDGTFDESFFGTVESGASGGLTFHAELPADQLRGSFDSSPFDDEIKSHPFELFVSWSDYDLATGMRTTSFLPTSFELRRGLAEIAWRTDAQDAGVSEQTGDAGVLSTADTRGHGRGQQVVQKGDVALRVAKPASLVLRTQNGLSGSSERVVVGVSS